MLFPQAGFMKNFPYYDRTKLDDVFGEGGNVQYGMDGKFLSVQPQIAVFTHSISNPPACVPCVWHGTFNQRMMINLLRVKGICKGKDVPQPWMHKGGSTKRSPSADAESPQSQKKQADRVNVEEDSITRKQREILSKPFVFEQDDDDEMAYVDGLREMEGAIPWMNRQPSSWIEGMVLKSILNLRKDYHDGHKVMLVARKALQDSAKFRYVSMVVDFLYSVYGPSGLAVTDLSVCKYMLVYLMTCCTFNVDTFHSKPTYTACAFLGPCTQIGRPMNYVVNYDMLFSQDAPYVTMPMDYTLYGSSIQSKVFGGPCITKALATQCGILQCMPDIFVNKSKAPYFILMTPCVPFPERNSEERGVAMLAVLSFEEIVSRLHSEKMGNLIARACGYDNLRCLASAEPSEITTKLSCLSVSTTEAEIITQLLKDKVATSDGECTTEDGVLMTWDEDYQISEAEGNHEMGMSANVEDLINKYQ